VSFPPGTPVAITHGKAIPIEAVLAGDTVITYTGTPRKVLRTIAGPHDGEMVAIEAVDDEAGPDGERKSYRLSATPDHQLGRVVDPELGGWVWCAIGNLQPGHVLRRGGGWTRAMVVKVFRVVYKGAVHCLEVDLEHSFLAGGFDAHNRTLWVARAAI
jgi:hypothetical protein